MTASRESNLLPNFAYFFFSSLERERQKRRVGSELFYLKPRDFLTSALSGMWGLHTRVCVCVCVCVRVWMGGWVCKSDRVRERKVAATLCLCHHLSPNEF